MHDPLPPVDASNITPLTHDVALQLQRVELDRFLALTSALQDHEWSIRTECPDWDVRDMVLHVLGACEAGASVRENAHQMRKAFALRRRSGGPLEAALSSVQVRERQALRGADIVERFAAVAPRTIRGRSRVPSLVRRVRMTVDGPVVERWSLGYLIDTIYLRDLWMHRVDVCRATGRTLELTAEHDGVIVADVVAEWMRRHDTAVQLHLTGPAGGTFVSAPSAADLGPVELDAVEFCRSVSGRESVDGTGDSKLLATIVPF